MGRSPSEGERGLFFYEIVDSMTYLMFLEWNFALL
ncbi:hypothetical protein SAMN05421766_102260 [Zobellia uliginosa]|uniref:Uncharacterized protein n=1 Tax=Zobellia uliginosa TaxID=143224 RepID=A0ABY1KLV7_9FLAO|nr:hypothetical protein SAMN05421766_102260 [Zobellia uliginosa]